MDVIDLRFGPSLRTLVGAKAHRLAAIGGRLRPQVLHQDVTRRAQLVTSLGQRLGAALTRRTALERDALKRSEQRLALASQRLQAGLSRSLEAKTRHLAGQSSLLEALSYRSALERGFAVVRTEKGVVVRAKSAIKADARLTLTFLDGDVKVRASDGPVQGSLFD
jgi:exodeoxyribonuclease VII large subunit